MMRVVTSLFKVESISLATSEMMRGLAWGEPDLEAPKEISI